MAEANREYERRFNNVFIVCATGKTAPEILEILRRRLRNDDAAELREAARLEPEWPEADFALGEAYSARRDCDSALAWYARVPMTHDRYVESAFATGVCRLLLGQPDRAEAAFTSLQEAMKNNLVSGADLPEILNDLAIARARQGKTAAEARGWRDWERLEDRRTRSIGISTTEPPS